MDKIAVLVPCYNEAQTIKKVVEDAKRVLPEAIVYVYDNNSTDGTAQIASDAGAVVRYERLQGKGNVIRRMFRDIDAHCYIMVDGDDTYPMENAREMADAVLVRNVDMVIGDRLSSTYYMENKRPFHNMGNAMVKGAINGLFDCDIQDIMTGYRAFSYSFVKTFPVLSKGFEIETEMTIHAVYNNMHLENVIVDYRDRPAGSVSKLNTYTDGMRVIKTIIKLYKNYRPFGFFLLLAFILSAIAIGTFIPVALDFLHTGLVERFPTLIVCGFVELAAVQAFFAGMILSDMAQKNRRDFEIKLMQVAQQERNSEDD
ncbi:MAG: glycosyltransferase family 2 protein [Butyrivibrio sp.]|nr:glycosyltransferase family 2 protein [Butyrivibrio sp.]